jgi:hypothetical protein
MIGARWNAESEEVKSYWRAKARQNKLDHALAYPGYKFQPRSSAQKKRRAKKNVKNVTTPAQDQAEVMVPAASKVMNELDEHVQAELQRMRDLEDEHQMFEAVRLEAERIEAERLQRFEAERLQRFETAGLLRVEQVENFKADAALCSAPVNVAEVSRTMGASGLADDAFDFEQEYISDYSSTQPPSEFVDWDLFPDFMSGFVNPHDYTPQEISFEADFEALIDMNSAPLG